jgi:hypothetical protein
MDLVIELKKSIEQRLVVTLINFKKPDTSKFTKETNIETTPLNPREAFEKKEYLVGLAGISLGINRWLFLGTCKNG